MKILEEACECNMDEDRFAGNCVGDISKSLGLSQPTVSNHVKELVNSKLVEAKRVGRKIFLFGSEESAIMFRNFGNYFCDEVLGHE